MSARLPWLAHLSRAELELLATELAAELVARPPSPARDRVEAGLGRWAAIAEAYGSVSAAPDDPDGPDGPADPDDPPHPERPADGEV
ncbi:hypothetical protein [Puerhibacterium sp. TATVAM-FAB25]|uniref:hypothetical protein n=1 Tax=Puerhibacterium sp. TATVAM-FAB25 TaxID=3093699 RepID=UPI00397E4F0D